VTIIKDPEARRARFTERLMEALAERAIGQNELARLLEPYGLMTQPSTVHGWMPPRATEAGDEPPSLPGGKFLLVLPEILRINGHWLLTGAGPREITTTGDEAVEQILSELTAFVRDLSVRFGRRPPVSTITAVGAEEEVRQLLQDAGEAEELLRRMTARLESRSRA
jgi:hypothetical protein